MRLALTRDELAARGRQCSGGIALSDTEAHVLGAIASHAFFGPTACPSQALIAAETGYSREWVCKVARRLWQVGLLCWAKARRIGSRWDHNVYRLKHWTAPPRARLLALLDKLHGRRVHTERTATTLRRNDRQVEAFYEPVFEAVYDSDRGPSLRLLVSGDDDGWQAPQDFAEQVALAA